MRRVAALTFVDDADDESVVEQKKAGGGGAWLSESFINQSRSWRPSGPDERCKNIGVATGAALSVVVG